MPSKFVRMEQIAWGLFTLAGAMGVLAVWLVPPHWATSGRLGVTAAIFVVVAAVVSTIRAIEVDSARSREEWAMFELERAALNERYRAQRERERERR